VAEPGTELWIRNVLPGIKQLSGEKLQWYLGSELRDRIRHSGVELLVILDEQRRAEEDQTSREVLRSIQKALKEALLALPAEEYDWFDLHEPVSKKAKAKESVNGEGPTEPVMENEPWPLEPAAEESGQKQFFEFPGPLFSVRISPASSVVPVAGSKNLRAISRDRANRLVDQGVGFQWTLLEGDGQLENPTSEIATFRAPAEPGLCRLRLTVKQGELECSAEALVTVTQSLLPEFPAKEVLRQGIPSYTFQKATGELWRSRYQAEQNVVVINNGHRDFVFASRNRMLKLRYIGRLFAKELVVKNFSGLTPGELLERLIELSLYTEENLR